MNQYEPSNSYSTNDVTATTRFIELLLQVQSRVSSPKVTSSQSIYGQGNGFLDKIECYSLEGISVNKIRERCNQLNYSTRGVKLKDKRLYLEINCNECFLHFYLGHPLNQTLRNLFFNPSQFSNITHMMNLLKEVIGDQLEEFQLSRVDYAVDIPVEYLEVLRGLDVKYKRANSEFLGNSIRTGLVVGTKDDKVKVYDKSKELGLDHPLTRIERQVRGSYLIVKKLIELPESLGKILNFKPLSIVSTNHLEFLDGICKTTEQFKKFNEIKVLIEYEGYFLTKKKLNKNGNFKRDYAIYFALTPYVKQPNEHFEQGILNFYKEN